MDEQGADEQFEATDYDEEGNIKLPPPPLVAAKKTRTTVAGLKKDLQDMESYIENEILAWCGQLDVRLEGLETTTATHNKTLIGDVKARLDNNDAAIRVLSDTIRSLIEEPAATPQSQETELEFAQPPQQMAGGQSRKSAIETVASICQHMTDVLMICRALKATPDLPDEDRTYLLTIACRAAGVALSPGLQIRAGVRNVEA